MKRILTFLFLVCGMQLIAQDFHVSQYDVLTMYNNPALTGIYSDVGNKDMKIYATHRSQAKIANMKPFRTYSLAYDQHIRQVGLGAYVIDNKTGLGMNTLSFLLSASYSVIKAENSPHILTAGLQMGIINKSFNPSKYLYESQFNTSTETLDANIASGETFSKTNLTKFDANMGIYYRYRNEDSKYHPFVGFSIYHITRPNESFTSVKSKLPMRFNFNTGCEIVMSEKVTITPGILYMNQATSSELNVGFIAAYRVRGITDIIYGINYRNKDAFVFHAGVRINGFIFRMSYDINTSYLSSYSGKGAYEFSLVYAFGKETRKAGHSSSVW